MVLVCQSADTRLAGEDGDHVGTMKLFLTSKERAEGGNGHWRMRMWEPSAIEIWETKRPQVISPEILSFCRRKIEERDQKEEPDLCIRTVQELVGQWSLVGIGFR
jgi:hypothetical protein